MESYGKSQQQHGKFEGEKRVNFASRSRAETEVNVGINWLSFHR